jgi:hypothetical protein
VAEFAESDRGQGWADGPVFGWGVCWLVRFIIGGENVGAFFASGPLGVR